MMNSLKHVLMHFKNSVLYPIFIIIFFINVAISVFFSWGSLGGFNIYTNISDSMYPTIEKGDLLVIAKKNMNTYKIGDIISFYGNYQGESSVITHRIHDIGGNVYITKGDNNKFPDAQVLRPRLIIGEVVAIIPKIGDFVINYKSTPSRLAFIIFPTFVIMLTEYFYLAKLKKTSVSFK